MGAGVEAGELFVGCAADPVVDAAVLLAQIDGAFEHHGLAGLATFHLDRVFVWPPAFALERRFPNLAGGGIGLELNVAIELFALGLLNGSARGWVVRSPVASPSADDLGHLGWAFGLLALRQHGRKYDGQDEERYKAGTQHGEISAIEGREIFGPYHGARRGDIQAIVRVF